MAAEAEGDSGCWKVSVLLGCSTREYVAGRRMGVRDWKVTRMMVGSREIEWLAGEGEFSSHGKEARRRRQRERNPQDGAANPKTLF